MAVQSKDYLKTKFARIGARPTDIDLGDLIDTMVEPGTPITADQVPDDVVGSVADKVMNDPVFQEQFSINKVDDISNPNSNDVVTSKGVSDAVATPFLNYDFANPND